MNTDESRPRFEPTAAEVMFWETVYLAVLAHATDYDARVAADQAIISRRAAFGRTDAQVERFQRKYGIGKFVLKSERGYYVAADYRGFTWHRRESAVFTTRAEAIQYRDDLAARDQINAWHGTCRVVRLVKKK